VDILSLAEAIAPATPTPIYTNRILIVQQRKPAIWYMFYPIDE
jgi:hypothetical protein